MVDCWDVQAMYLWWRGASPDHHGKPILMKTLTKVGSIAEHQPFRFGLRRVMEWGNQWKRSGCFVVIGGGGAPRVFFCSWQNMVGLLGWIKSVGWMRQSLSDTAVCAFIQRHGGAIGLDAQKACRQLTWWFAIVELPKFVCWWRIWPVLLWLKEKAQARSFVLMKCWYLLTCRALWCFAQRKTWFKQPAIAHLFAKLSMSPPRQKMQPEVGGAKLYERADC